MKKLILAFGVAASLFAFQAKGVDNDNLEFSPLGLGIAAPIQLPFMNSDVYGLRLGGLFAVEREVIGLDIGLVERTKLDFTGLQASAFSITGRDAGCSGRAVAEGLNLFAGLCNLTSGSHIGGIFGLCNIVYGDVTGLEVGVVNYDSSILGMQIGAVNWNSFASAGAQVGVYNKNVGKFTGLNLGGISFAEEIVGAQIGFINCVDNCTGLQLGVINACENMAGIQIGALNLIATSPVSAMVVANVMF